MAEHLVRQAFEETFGDSPAGIGFSPGRINLIGEHIDYCGGLVMPMAISRGTWFAFSPNDESLVRARSENFSEQRQFDLKKPQAASSGWIDYAAGMAQALGATRGIDIVLAGNISGGGLSSSASFTMAVALGLLAAAGSSPASDADRLALAQTARAVENDFVGVACGIMDPASVALGGIVMLDCARLEFERVDSPESDYRFVVMDTKHPRTLASSAYNERVTEIDRALSALGNPVPAAQLCRVLSEGDIAALEQQDMTLFRRLRHVTTEHGRVREAHAALASGNLERLGELLAASHASLRDDYEVTGVALDTIVEASMAQPGVIGARMTGAGFGGCAIALVHRDAVEGHARAVRQWFERETGIEPDVFEVAASPGAGVSQA